MKIFIKVKPKSKVEKIKRIDENHFEVWVKEPPVKGKANQAIIKILAAYFNIPSLKIKIISGHFSRQKMIEVMK